MHYIHERDSFVPLMQIRQPRAMVLNETPDVKALMEANGRAYDIEQDPLWNGEQRSVPSAFERKDGVLVLSVRPPGYAGGVDGP